MGIIGVFYLSLELGRIAARAPFIRRVEEIGLQFHLGLAILAPAVLALGMWSVSSASTLLALAGIPAGLVMIVGVMRAKARPGGSRARLSLSPLEWCCIVAIAVMNLLTLIAGWAPVTSWDAAVAHLSLPAGYVRLDRIALLPGNVYSAYPQFLHSLFALGVRSDGVSDALALNWILCVASCAAVGGLGAQIGGRTAGLIAAAMFATAPIFAAQAGTVAIDVPFAGFIASALLALVIWDETNSLRYLVAAAVIAGGACGIRHTGYLAAFFMFVWIVLQSKESRAKSAATFAAFATLASAPWWLRSWILVGNPVYPLLTSVFGNGGMPDVQVTGLLQHETARSAGVFDLLTFPWRIVMQPERFDGWQASAGGLVMVLGVVGVLAGGRIARWLGGFSLAGIVTIYYVQRFARYLFPFFMPMHVTGALAAAGPGPLRRPIAALLVFSYIYGLGLAVGTSYYKWPVVFGLESREDYLTRRVERYPAFQWINAHAPQDATVLTLDPRSYFIHRASFQNLGALQRLAGKPIETQLLWMKQQGIRYIFIPDAYMASSPIFRERGILPLVESWRADGRFRTIYSEDLRDPRGGGAEHVTILEVVGGDGSGTA